MKHSSENTALILIDILNDFQFSNGEKLLKHTKEILPNILKLKAYAKKNNLPIIYVNDHYGTWKADIDKIATHCRNEKNANILDQVLPTTNDYFLMKPKLSGFYQTALPSLLRELKVTHIILAGVAGNICVLFTANDAHMRDFSVSVPKNCVASTETHENEQALNLMKIVLSANIDPI
ncbi:cysteine hydrolase [Aquibacillus sp. 3ASR75-11]|uniref:Cysteine hydrolase n=1 Tax=Terrihalobacillus insolitus TaxID=2950438 RepID=A0A9X3WV45_9BACI|nr:isochorismatase family cysteine hydrolase [Terrihalobacillus insolitus]MDC3415246.1 cysteine hydrolase [Terrihalobacillus insolitus]MDC3426317.1 cysteine hydrolase [Terrihalobacillus insolitus]